MNTRILYAAGAMGLVFFLAAIPPLAVVVRAVIGGGIAHVFTFGMAVAYGVVVLMEARASLAGTKGYELAGEAAIPETTAKLWRWLAVWHLVMSVALVAMASFVSKRPSGFLGVFAPMLCLGIMVLAVVGVSMIPLALQWGLEDRITGAMQAARPQARPSPPTSAERSAAERPHEDDEGETAAFSNRGLKKRRD